MMCGLPVSTRDIVYYIVWLISCFIVCVWFHQDTEYKSAFDAVNLCVYVLTESVLSFYSNV